ncbi:hypothetical protein C5B42_00150 [Candidatus Cerribacteria bacterium 'Amazon FNV 2010 28 9']|uniref:DUF559 domain-containing protein n=1 Tax=Candidatus Cerribacteria bacterium 'Amazon FNV 2010 28 9' TaxID=2081795 RepID=A0A317JQR0_9BACT|nr:MAG: hypothetical protein C5B42_00150 [Candidatus Cerribacteria bacterium 'Amazon FNV 2010 28 9']
MGKANASFNSANQKKLRQILRSPMPPAEYILWQYLRRKNLKGYKFRRQYGVDRYVLDFYCPAAHLGIELDGESHCEERAEYDKQRQDFIEQFGITILRFPNLEIYTNLDAVLDAIALCLPNHQPPLTPPSKGGEVTQTS